MKLFFSIITLNSLLSTTLLCYAQSNDSKNLFWISPTVGRTAFPSLMVAAGYEPNTNKSVFISRYSINAEMFPNIEPGIKIKEFGLLYGLKAGRLRGAIGISSVWGNLRGVYLYTDPDPLMGSGRVHEYVPYRTIGIPGELRYSFASKHIGIGITAFGNLNNKRSFGGLGVSLYVGKLK